MLKRHSQLLVGVLVIGDLAVLAGAWCAAYFERFYFPFRVPVEARPPLSPYLLILPVVLLFGLVSHYYNKLYVPRRTSYFHREIRSILRSAIYVTVALIVMSFLTQNPYFRYSKGVILVFAVNYIACLTVERTIVRTVLWRARAKGYNLRRALIVGAGKTGQALARSIARNKWTGIEVAGYIDDREERFEKDIRGLSVLGGTGELVEIAREHSVDQIYIALPPELQGRAYELIDELGDQMMNVYLIPDFRALPYVNVSVGDFDGIPMVSFIDTPIYGWQLVAKRAFDIFFSLAAVLAFGVPMLVIALFTKLTSKGPVFYKQERMGLDGRTFNMLKFRSMKVGAEAETGAVWAVEDDPRRTKWGAFLRKTSLDEIPQFFNVLAGHMSIVGPRPERPVFIEQFRNEVPRYMLRHKVKAGITGWAQINGWRGDTSLRKRIQFDLYYIRNWSIWFDLYIMVMTVFRGMVSKTAY